MGQLSQPVNVQVIHPPGEGRGGCRAAAQTEMAVGPLQGVSVMGEILQLTPGSCVSGTVVSQAGVSGNEFGHGMGLLG